MRAPRVRLLRGPLLTCHSLAWVPSRWAWAPGLLVVGAGTRGVGYFSSGKNNSLRSDIFFPARKIPHTPLPTGSTGIGRFSSENPPMPVGAGWSFHFSPEKDV